MTSMLAASAVVVIVRNFPGFIVSNVIGLSQHPSAIINLHRTKRAPHWAGQRVTKASQTSAG